MQQDQNQGQNTPEVQKVEEAADEHSDAGGQEIANGNEAAGGLCASDAGEAAGRPGDADAGEAADKPGGTDAGEAADKPGDANAGKTAGRPGGADAGEAADEPGGADATGKKGKRKKGKKEKRKEKPKKKKHRLLKFFLFNFVLLIAAAAVCWHLVKPYYYEAKESMYQSLTSMDGNTFRRTGNTYIYDADGEEIGQIGNENYEYVEISSISDYITNGYIAVEDQRFTQHHGVDVKGTVRAALTLIKNKGKITQGGSTITQQVVKNNLLSSEQTYMRKLTEILIALEVEKEFTKAQIMEYYCNSNFYGQNCYGVEGACQYYFGKSAKEVSLAEAAMLVGVSNSPSANNPVADYEKADSKKESVLASMLEAGYISETEYSAAMDEHPEIVAQSSNHTVENYMTGYAVYCASLELMEKEGFAFQYVFETAEEEEEYDAKYEEAYNTANAEIRGGGYSIYTSFRQDVQDLLQEQVDDGLKDFTQKQEDGRYELQGAAVCIDNDTQLVIAMVGGRGTDDSYNRGYQAKRQPGSSIKPLLVYGPAINEGIVTPGSKVTDKKTEINGYSPKNSDGKYRGRTTVREALARSTNTIALQLLDQTGRNTCLSYLGALKFSSLRYADSTVDSISLGGFTDGVRVCDMARGYAVLASGGTMKDVSCLTKITTEAGETIYELDKSASGTEIYTEDASFMMTDMLQGVFRQKYGTAHDAYEKGTQYAGKTGTTNSYKDAWFCGYSTEITCTVWVGCDTPKSIDNLKGSTYPLSIWSSFMKKMEEDYPSGSWTAPATVHYENSSGREKEIEEDDDLYDARPSGWDYVSDFLEAKGEETENQERIDKEISEAEEAVSEFEDFQITSAEEAESLDSKYQEVCQVIEEVEDDEQKKAFLERAAYKYSLLSGEVADEWEAAIAEEKSQELQKKKENNALEAQKSKEKATETLKENRVSLVNWYISMLEERTVYTSTLAQILTDAKSALSACSGYDEYSSLSQKLSKAETYVNGLPTEEDIEAEAQSWEAEKDSWDPEGKLAEQQSAESILDDLKKSRTDLVEWYISALNGCELKTSQTDDMISDAKSALSECSEYDEYSSLKSRLNSAISYVKKLDTVSDVQKEIDSIQTPELSDYGQ